VVDEEDLSHRSVQAAPSKQLMLHQPQLPQPMAVQSVQRLPALQGGFLETARSPRSYSSKA